MSVAWPRWLSSPVRSVYEVLRTDRDHLGSANGRSLSDEDANHAGEVLTTRKARGEVVVRAEGLTKRYASGTEAVRGISFEVKAGEIVGVVGPNGAGKSTTLSILASLIAPTEGDAWISGTSIRDRDAVRPLLGVALQEAGLDPLLSVDGHFTVQGALYRMRPELARKRTEELLETFQLAPMRSRRAGQLSGGMQRRVSLALALLHDPAVVIFDEPTVGLDPASTRILWSLLERLRANGLAILLTTHYMEEADRLCDYVMVIDKGRVLVSGTPAELKKRVGESFLRLTVGSNAASALAAVRAAASAGRLHPEASAAALHGDTLFIPVLDGAAALPPILRELQERSDSTVVSLSWTHGTLEDVFIRLTGDAPDEESNGTSIIENHTLARRRGSSRRRGGA